jgi:hypothetical protein
MSLLLALTAGGAPAAVTGTAVWTEGNDTAVGVATYGPTGTAAVLEGNDTAAGVATFGPSATVAFTEGNDTATVAASFGPTATAAWTEGNDTIAASVAVQVTATIAFTEGDDTIAATGTGGSTPEADTGSHTGYDYILPKPRRPLRVPTPKPPPPVVGLVRITETDDGIDAVGFASLSLSDNDFEMLLLLQLV